MADQAELHVHIVEDNERIADMYRKWLSNKYTATVSYNGESALEEIDGDVDIVLLDRDLPGISGDEVLTKLREQSRNSYLISMLTAQDPKVELAQLNCDEYVRKPVPEEKLVSVVGKLFDRLEYSPELREYVALGRRLELIEEQYSDRQLSDQTEYEELQSKLKKLNEEVKAEIDTLSHNEQPDISFNV